MDKITISGGNKIDGEVYISGAKNAALPLMAASLLTDEEIKLSNVPFLSDITTMANLLVSIGTGLLVYESKAKDFGGRTLSLTTNEIKETKAPYNIVRKMRASVIVLGPLLARNGEAEISLPGGCAIGTRPIDLHLSGFEKMGVKIKLKDGYIKAKINGKLKGADIDFSTVSVGATENIILAATLAEGITNISNAAKEPEIIDLCNCLNQMGAEISGIGTSNIKIIGKERLNGTEYKVMPDRIEAGTYAIAAAITKGNILLKNINSEIMQSTLNLLEKTGSEITIDDEENTIHISADKNIKPIDIETAPYPDFPTDMQAQFTALMCFADGISHITENIFENRFMHVAELQRMGADIVTNGKTITITGKKKLTGAEVMATDLRASVSLVLAALAIKGETTIRRVYHIDRGYERIEEKLSACGANITRTKALNV